LTNRSKSLGLAHNINNPYCHTFIIPALPKPNFIRNSPIVFCRREAGAMFGFMGTTLTLILMLATLALAAVWCIAILLRNRYTEHRRNVALRKLQEKVTQRESNSPRSFRAVSIIPARPSCKLVNRYSGTRYLTTEAPHLPLAGCRVQPCRCRYAHYDDRRVEDRRNPFGIDHVPIGIDSNRRARDRRRPRVQTLQYS
jgi:hypothetical protein